MGIVTKKFTWDDLEDKKVFSPCDYCNAITEFPCDEDGATSTACNYCSYKIMNDCLRHNTDDREWCKQENEMEVL